KILWSGSVPIFAGTTSAGSRSRWAAVAPSSIVMRWACCLHKPSKKTSAPPVAHYYFARNNAPLLDRHGEQVAQQRQLQAHGVVAAWDQLTVLARVASQPHVAVLGDHICTQG